MTTGWIWNPWFPRRKRTCKKKGRYRTREEAVEKADAYNRRVLFADMQAYCCWRHERWHIGHATKYGESRGHRELLTFHSLVALVSLDTPSARG